MCILARELKRDTHGTKSTLYQYVNQRWHICIISLRCNKRIKVILEDKCYGSTAGSNPVSEGSTPSSSANFGLLAQLDRAHDYES